MPNVSASKHLARALETLQTLQYPLSTYAPENDSVSSPEQCNSPQTYFIFCFWL